MTSSGCRNILHWWMAVGGSTDSWCFVIQTFAWAPPLAVPNRLLIAEIDLNRHVNCRGSLHLLNLDSLKSATTAFVSNVGLNYRSIPYSTSNIFSLSLFYFMYIMLINVFVSSFKDYITLIMMINITLIMIINIYCPCGVWCGLTTCLLHVGPLLEIEF